MNNKKFDQLEAEELDAITLDILIDNNLKKAQAEDLMKTFDREKKILVCQQHGKRMETHPNDTALSYCIRLKKLLNSTDDPKELLLSLRVSLSSQNVNWIEEFGSAGGFHLLVQTMDRLMQQIEKVRFDPEQAHREDEIVNCLLELIKSTRTCLNCQPGVKFLFLPNSQLCFKLIEILYVASAAKFDDNSQNLYMQLIVKVLQLLAAISFLGRNGNDDNDMTGNSLLIRDLSIAAERRNVSRFACIVRCFHFNDSETTYRALNVINTLLSNVDDGEWQIRMIWRSELMASGLKALLPSIENLASTDERINTAYNSFIGERKADYEELLGHSEELAKDIESPQDCFNMLVATCKNTDCDELLQDIFVRLLMVDDRKYKRFTYFAMIRMCLSEIVFGDMGNGPEFGRQIVFSTPIEEALKEIESNHKNSRMGTLLESAISAKQDAISLQLKYYEKILEFQTECDSLRKFIESHGQDGSVQGVLPSKTLCDLPAPSRISGTSCSTSQVPPAPPPPPPTLLGKNGGGPPPPPPPPPGLLKSNSAKGPPAPPPPPPGLLNSKAGVPPAPPISIKASPEVPSFLKRKLSRAPEVPMKKIPWNSVLIHPSKLTSNSLWAQLDDAEIASDDVFEGLKANFSSKNPVAAQNAPNKIQNKGKESVVIQDAKVLQRLAILQGSCKIGLNRWRSAILSIDEKVLNANLLSQLIGAIPSSEVINKLRECTEEEVKKMPEGEQFVAILSAIPALPIRLEAIQLKFSWAETYTELKNSVTTIAEACDEIFTSNGLKNFINLVLLTGNFMARSKNTKDAFAFELSALSKLADTKSVDNSDTLLNFLIGVFDAKYKGKFTNFVDEFHHVLKATRIDLMETTKNKNTLAGSFRKVSNYLANYKKQCEIDNFHEKIGAFIETAQKDLNSLDRLWEHMNKKWEALQTYLCFDPKKYPMEKLFGDLKTFIELYQRALRAILASKNKAEQKKNAENAKRKPLKGLQPMADAINQAKNQRGKIVSEDSGVIDRIEMMLEQGKYRPYNRSAPGTSYRVRRKGNTTLHVTQGENIEIEKPCNKVANANYEPSSETNAEEVDANRKLKDYNQPQSKGVPSAIELLTRLNNL